MSVEAVFIVHAYQPVYPIQIHDVVKRINTKTYLPFAKSISESEKTKLVLNMNGCLTEMLQKEYPDTISLLRKAIGDGIIEMIDSGMYHPILPFLEDESEEFFAQIDENKRVNSGLLGLSEPCIGFWPPELAVSTKTVKMLAAGGYKIIMSPSNILKERRNRTLYAIKSGRASAILLSRHHDISNNIAFRRYGDDVDRAANDICKASDWSGMPVVLSMDLETFGAHHDSYLSFLMRLLNHSSLRWINLSQLVNGEYHIDYITDIASTSWSTDDWERDRGVGYQLWRHPQNPLHQTQNAHLSLLRMCCKILGGIDQLSPEQRQKYMIAQHSCQMWWAGLGSNWSPDMVKKGFVSQIDAMQELAKSLDNDVRQSLVAYSDFLHAQLVETIRTRL